MAVSSDVNGAKGNGATVQCALSKGGLANNQISAINVADREHSERIVIIGDENRM
jgi:hypothetical protein